MELSSDTAATTALSEIWDQFKDEEMARITSLEGAVVALLEDALSESQRAVATTAAHQLAGTLGTFGFSRASEHAAEIEQMLRGSAPLGPIQALSLSEMVVALRSALEGNTWVTSPGTTRSDSMPPPPDATRVPAAADSSALLGHSAPEPLVLLVDDDPLVVHRLEAEAAARGMRARSALSIQAARRALAEECPDAVLLDLMFSGGEEEGLQFLREIRELTPRIPVIVFTGKDDFVDRVQVAQLGGCGFLDKSCSAADAIEVVTRILSQREPDQVRILAVDDDPIILAGLETLFSTEHMRLSTLDDPRRFWTALESVAPDLVILDVDMPGLTGIELCRVMRNDARWSTVPVVFVTARRDSETVERIFAAGADDYVAKPIVPAELRVRIQNRLERARLYKSLVESDTLTGLANRRKANEVLTGLLRLAERQRQPVSVAVLDIDHFKRINDRYGHGTGDGVLQGIASVLRRSLRSEDIVSRWGGEEFFIGMYGMRRADGVERLAHILETLQRHTFPGPGGDVITTTFSAGVAQFPLDGSDLQTLYRAADLALYAAKQAGRGRVLPYGWQPDEADGEAGGNADVVIVDDDEVVGNLLVHALTTRGYHTRWIKDGTLAAHLLCGRSGGAGRPVPPLCRARVIVLDVGLPGLDGLSLLRRLAETGVTRRSRVIMLTTRASETEIVAALDIGASDHVAKPFSLPVLMQRIRRAAELA